MIIVSYLSVQQTGGRPKYVKDEKGHMRTVYVAQTLRAIPLVGEQYENGLIKIKRNTRCLEVERSRVNLALEYIALGIRLMDSTEIAYCWRYAILEYARSVEIILGSWKKEWCATELKNKGYDQGFIEQVKQLLDYRGDYDVAHPPFSKKHAGMQQAKQARDVAIGLIMGEMNFR